jgi:hypothetical protein
VFVPGKFFQAGANVIKLFYCRNYVAFGVTSV